MKIQANKHISLNLNESTILVYGGEEGTGLWTARTKLIKIKDINEVEGIKPVTGNKSYKIETEEIDMEWKEKKKVIPTIANLEKVPPKKDSHSAVVKNENTILIYGGTDNLSRISGEGIIYELCLGEKEFEWTHKIIEKEKLKDRMGHQMSILKNKLYIVGGKSINVREMNKMFKEIWEVDIEKNTAQKKKDPMKAIVNHVQFLHKNSIYVFGGKDENGYSNDMMVYDISKDIWELKKPMQNIVPEPREAAAIANISKDHILLFGGWGKGGAKGDVWLYNILKNEWRELKKNVKQPRYGHTLNYIESSNQKKGCIIIGGKNTEFQWIKQAEFINLEEIDEETSFTEKVLDTSIFDNTSENKIVFQLDQSTLPSVMSPTLTSTFEEFHEKMKQKINADREEIASNLDEKKPLTKADLKKSDESPASSKKMEDDPKKKTLVKGKDSENNNESDAKKNSVSKTITKKEAEDKVKLNSIIKSNKEGEDKAKNVDVKVKGKEKKDADEKAKKEAEERAKKEAESKAKKEAEDKAKKDDEEKAKSEAKAKKEAKAKPIDTTESKVKKEVEKKNEKKDVTKVNKEGDKAKEEAEVKGNEKKNAEAKAKAEIKEHKKADETPAGSKVKKEAEEKAKVIDEKPKKEGSDDKNMESLSNLLGFSQKARKKRRARSVLSYDLNDIKKDSIDIPDPSTLEITEDSPTKVDSTPRAIPTSAAKPPNPMMMMGGGNMASILAEMKKKREQKK